MTLLSKVDVLTGVITSFVMGILSGVFRITLGCASNRDFTCRLNLNLHLGGCLLTHAKSGFSFAADMDFCLILVLVVGLLMTTVSGGVHFLRLNF